MESLFAQKLIPNQVVAWNLATDQGTPTPPTPTGATTPESVISFGAGDATVTGDRYFFPSADATSWSLPFTSVSYGKTKTATTIVDLLPNPTPTKIDTTTNAFMTVSTSSWDSIKSIFAANKDWDCSSSSKGTDGKNYCSSTKACTELTADMENLYLFTNKDESMFTIPP